MSLPSLSIFSIPIAVVPFSAVSVMFGLACVAAVFALHHLRVQPKQRWASTLLFWQQAVRSSQARVPWSRQFTHRRTFLLLALILLLLALVLTADQWNRLGDQARDIIVIDAGQETAAPILPGASSSDRRTFLRELADAAIADLGHLSSSPGLVVAGPIPSLFVSPRQPAVITARVLGNLHPQQGASASSIALQMARDVMGDTPGRIFWYTSQPVLPAELPDTLLHSIVLRQIVSPPAVVISGVTFVPASDGIAEGSLRVELSGAVTDRTRVQAASPRYPPISLPVPLPLKSSTVREPYVSFDHWPADGRPVTLTLINAPGAPASHTIEFQTPDCRPPVFQFGQGAPTALRAAFLATGVEASNSNGASPIFVASEGTPVPAGSVASICIQEKGPQVRAGLPLQLMDSPLLQGLSLEGAVSATGPGLTGSGVPLVVAGSVPVIELDSTSRLPTLRLSGSVIDEAADLPRHAAFPVLMKRLCDALTARTEAPVAIAESRSASDPLCVGPHDLPAPNRVVVADALPQQMSVSALSKIEKSALSVAWSDLLLVVATALLLVESVLYARRRIV